MIPQVIYTHFLPCLQQRLSDCTSSVVILCPFIKEEPLLELIESINDTCRITIATRWNDHIFTNGASDPSIFEICKKKNIRLLKNNRIHLKTWLFDNKTIATGSTNISKRALGMLNDNNNEALVLDIVATDYDRLVISEIVKHSMEISEDDYTSACELPKNTHDDFPDEDKIHPWFIEDLPQTPTLKSLFADYTDADVNNIDIQKMQLPSGLTKEYFNFAAQEHFLSQPYVKELKESLRKEDLRFGMLKQWLCDHCHDAVRPDARHITNLTSNLLNWLMSLGKGNFYIHRPNHAEIVGYHSTIDEDSIIITSERYTKPQ